MHEMAGFRENTFGDDGVDMAVPMERSPNVCTAPTMRERRCRRQPPKHIRHVPFPKLRGRACPTSSYQNESKPATFSVS